VVLRATSRPAATQGECLIMSARADKVLMQLMAVVLILIVVVVMPCSVVLHDR